MSIPALRPPLPPPLSHDGITFTLDTGLACASRVSHHTLVAIAAGLQAILPPGDLTVDHNGVVVPLSGAVGPTSAPSLWYQSGLLAGIERGCL